VSHSKKWPKLKQYHENGEVVRNEKGKAELVNSYSLLQDSFYNHMREAGFLGFERGERGSTAEHLSDVEYKTQQEKKRAAEYTAIAEEKQEVIAAYDADISEKSKQSANLDKSVEKKQEKFNELTAKTAVAEKEVAEYEEIEKLGHKRGLLGGVTVSADWWTRILNLVKEAISSRSTIKKLRAENKELKADVKSASTALEQQKAAYLRLVDRVQPYLDAVKLFPQQVKETLANFIDMGRKKQEQEQKPPEIPTPERTAPNRKRSHDLDR
jgi:chromosome segregation ATPase